MIEFKKVEEANYTEDELKWIKEGSEAAQYEKNPRNPYGVEDAKYWWDYGYNMYLDNL